MPNSPRGNARWMVPIAFLGKEPTAPDLEVFSGAGARITAPTMLENMAMTSAALRMIALETGVPLDGMTPELIEQIVFEQPFEAEIACSVFATEAPDAEEFLGLLEKLQEQFLLWIPLVGASDSEHLVSVARRDPRSPKPVLRPGREEVSISYELDDGWADFMVEVSTSKVEIDFGQLFERILLAFGLRSIEIESDLDDMTRFTSYHHCVQAPQGFVVREIRVAGLTGAGRQGGESAVEWIEVPVAGFLRTGLVPISLEKEPSIPIQSQLSSGDGEVDASTWELDEIDLEELEVGPGLLVQGHDSEMAHVHCSREENVSPLIVRTTLATSGHLTSLWTSVVVLTAALLWLFDRHGPLEESQIGSHLQIAAGALLLVPTLAAAWAIRADESAATRTVLLGTRLLLLLCGVFSVSAALTLAGMLPREIGSIEGIKVYASLAYFAAVLVIASWVLSLRPTWYLYRHWLLTPLKHLRATAALLVLAVVVLLLARLGPVGCYGCAFASLAIGLLFVAVAANRIGSRLSESRGRAPVIAAFAATMVFVDAGYWLGFYDEVVRSSVVQLVGVSVLMLLFAASCRGLELRHARVSRRTETQAQAGN